MSERCHKFSIFLARFVSAFALFAQTLAAPANAQLHSYSTTQQSANQLAQQATNSSDQRSSDKNSTASNSSTSTSSPSNSSSVPSTSTVPSDSSIDSAQTKPSAKDNSSDDLTKDTVIPTSASGFKLLVKNMFNLDLDSKAPRGNRKKRKHPHNPDPLDYGNSGFESIGAY
jgi:cytoskeletal protein RodZ